MVDQVTAFTTTTGTAWATPAYDAAGNITTLPQPASLGSGYTGVYDAWNRLVKLSSGVTTIVTYSYDGRGRRIVKVTPAISETRHFYWSNQWQVLEERVGSSASADVQYTWGVRYTDDLACRNSSSGRVFEELKGT